VASATISGIQEPDQKYKRLAVYPRIQRFPSVSSPISRVQVQMQMQMQMLVGCLGTMKFAILKETSDMT
jgi:hypothetical protein